MTWRVEIHEHARRELRHLPDSVLKRVIARLSALEDDPFPRGVKKLKGHTGYRLRVGDYRLLYEVEFRKRLVVVYAVGHRRDVYR